MEDDVVLCETFELPTGDKDRCRWHLKYVEELANADFSLQNFRGISDFRRAGGLLETHYGKGGVWFVLYFRGPLPYQIDVVEDAAGTTVKHFGNAWVVLADSSDHLLGNLVDCGHWLLDHVPGLGYQFHYNLALSQLYALASDWDAANLHWEAAFHALEMSNSDDPNEVKELRNVMAIVRFYAPASPNPQHPVNVDFANRVRLYGYSLEPDVLSQASEVRMSFYWQVMASLEENYSVFVHLEDAEGNVVGHYDFQPYDGIFPMSQWPVGAQVREAREYSIPDDLPSGEYTLVIGLYLPRDMSRLEIVGDISGEDAVRLGTLVVDMP